MPLTAEEKKQRKAEKKAKKLKEAAELKIKIRKDELSREVENSQNNVSSLMKDWYTRNYELHFPKIKDEMEIAWSSFDRTMDLKDFVIDQLTENIEEARIQEAMSWQDYSIKIDELLGEFYRRTMSLKEEFDLDLKLLLEAASEGREIQQRTQEELEDYYKTILFMMEERFNESMGTAQGEYLTKRDEENKRGIQSTEEMSGGLEKTIQTVVRDISETLEEYKTSTEARRKELEALKAKDDFYNSMISRQNSKTARLVDEMNNLQTLLNEKLESKVALADLKKDREETYREYVEARMGMTTDAALDENNLLILSSESSNAIRDLERILEKGEKILRLGNLCRRLETQEEKVLPFGISVHVVEETKEVESTLLYNFMRKFSQATLIKEKLQESMFNILEENQDLQAQLETALTILAMSRNS